MSATVITMKKRTVEVWIPHARTEHDMEAPEIEQAIEAAKGQKRLPVICFAGEEDLLENTMRILRLELIRGRAGQW